MEEVNDMPKLSIIVPIDNNRTHLAQCIHSILAQTWNDFELLLIDDGSTDGSMAIGQRFAKQDQRVRYVFQSHQGTWSALNRGLDLARGEVLSFVLADDYLHPNNYLMQMAILEGNHCQIAGFSPLIINSDGTKRPAMDIHEHRYNGVYSVEQWFTIGTRDLHNCYYSIWGKVYQRSLFEGLHFVPGQLAVSAALMLGWVYFRVGRIAFTNGEMMSTFHRDRPFLLNSKDYQQLIQGMEGQLSLLVVRGKDPAAMLVSYRHLLIRLCQQAQQDGNYSAYELAHYKLQCFEQGGH